MDLILHVFLVKTHLCALLIFNLVTKVSHIHEMLFCVLSDHSYFRPDIEMQITGTSEYPKTSFIWSTINETIYCKIPKTSPSKCKPPKPVTQKTLHQITPPNVSAAGACTWKIALKYKVKQSKNGKFTSNYKASPIDFETQISLRR